MDSTLPIADQSAMVEVLSRELARCARYHRPFSALLIGFDRPGALSLGAPLGDIGELGCFVRRNIRSADMVGRYSEAELLVLLPETSGQGALTLAERVLSKVRQVSQSTIVPDGATRATISIGAVEYGADKCFLHNFLSAAERALRLAREQGGDRVQVAGWSGQELAAQARSKG